MLNLRDQVVNLRDQVLDFRDQVLDLRDQVLNLRDQVLDLRDQVLDLCDQVLNLRDQVLNLRDQVLDLCDQVLNLRDQVLNLRDRTGPDRTGLVAATGLPGWWGGGGVCLKHAGRGTQRNPGESSKRKGQASRDQQSGSNKPSSADPAREARRAIFLTLISGNVLGSIGNAKGMLSISAVAASQNAV